MPKTKWAISHATDEATKDVASLFEDEDIQAEIFRILKILRMQDDPRIPKPSSGLIVNELERDTPKWFRVKVPRYAIRIVFRLLIIRDEHLIELKSKDPVPNDDKEKYIEIMQARFRKDAYGEELKRRYRKYSSDEE
jgi:hypothetical protein